MLRHVAVFTFTPGTTESQIDALVEGLGTLAALVTELRGYWYGRDLGLGGNGDFAVVAEFEDEAGYRAYARHPAHLDVLERLLVPIRETRLAVQFTTGATGVTGGPAASG